MRFLPRNIHGTFHTHQFQIGKGFLQTGGQLSGIRYARSFTDKHQIAPAFYVRADHRRFCQQTAANFRIVFRFNFVSAADRAARSDALCVPAAGP